MKNFKSLITFIVMFTITVFVNAQNDQEKEILKAFNTISSNELFDYVKKLSSNEFNGRLSGSPEYMKSAKWVANHLEKWGIKPYGDNGTYFQYFHSPYTVIKDVGNVQVEIKNKNDETLIKNYSFPDDYYLGSNSGSGDVKAEVVFAGYGITAPELNYDDYKGVDVKGKIVLIETDIPVGRDAKDFSKWVPYSYHQEKLNNAVKHGAIGMLYVNHLANPNTSYNEGFVYCQISKNVAQDVFYNTGKNYQNVLAKIKKDLKPQSFNTGNKASITAKTVHYPNAKGCNVIGIIEGSDPILKNEVIIVGGHLDGVGNTGAVLPGALDNASGIADIMGAAKAFANSTVKPKRTIMFLFIGGEECGLLGSNYYTKNPKLSKEKTIAFFNIDMAGNGTGLSVSGTLSYPKIHQFFEDANNKYIHRTLRGSKEGGPCIARPRSDGSIFARAGFRVLGFGTTNSVKKYYYHHPLDNIDTITPEIMEDVAKLIYVGLLNMANANDLGL